MSDKKVFQYEGNDHTVTWDGRLCIHVGECGRAKGDLFVTGRDPWCEPDTSDLDTMKDVVARCPTGALAIKDAAGNTLSEPTATENTIMVSPNGPLYASGELSIDAATDDMPSVKHRAALCRCGKSQNKPFCDGAHEKAGFVDYGAVGETGLTLEDTSGNVAFVSIPDGPLEASGNLTLIAGSGRKAWQGRKVYLCRCGASKNKPFCDGSHKDIGFKTD